MIKIFKNIALWLKSLGREAVFYIGGSDTLPAPLSPSEEALAVELLKSDPPRGRRMLIEHNLRLVVYIARKFENTGVGIEDLISTGTIGLIKAINTFDPRRNIKLATYASRCVENEILMFLRKNSHLSREISLDEPLNVDWDGNELLLSDILGTSGDVVLKELEADVDRRILSDVIEKLSPRERDIIRLRFGLSGGEEKTQKEVADALGISQSYISRLEKKIILRLQKEIARLV
ncbi:MAG: RNA polymerase sporulation sigma factor SigE [Clostridia bacterium]|nr:RNA polymerase sporulation sigma factor SigE [Clostridia bacterium]